MPEEMSQLATGPVRAAALALHQFLLAEVPMGDTLQRIAQHARAGIEHAVAVGVSLADDRGGYCTSVATNARIAAVVDQAQYDSGSGPCLDCHRQRRIVVVDDTSRWAGTWPRFTEVALSEGVLSTLSLPLTFGDAALGAFNLYGTRRAAFGPAEQEQAEAFTAHAAVVVGNASAYWGAYNLAEDLRIAMSSRATIEQAKGMIIASRHCTPEEAFSALVGASQRSNVRLRDLAQRMVDGASRHHRGGPLPQG